MRLVARMPQASLKSGETTVTGLQADVDLTTTGDRVAVTAHSAATALSGPGGRGRDLRLTLTGALPYPDLKSRRGDGQARIEAALTAGSASDGRQRPDRRRPEPDLRWPDPGLDRGLPHHGRDRPGPDGARGLHRDA
jgi:hypothetical protein